MGETGIGSIGGYGSEVRYQPGKSLKHPGPLLPPTSNDKTGAAMRESLARQIATIQEAWTATCKLVAASAASKR